MRFSLLIVLTVALLSVAFRIHSHPSSSASRPPRQPSATPSIQAITPATPTTGSSASPSPSAVPHAVGGAGHGGQTGRPAAGGPAVGQQVLPVTGWDSTMKLGALAFLLIGGGALVLRAGAPRRQPLPTGQAVQD